MRLLTCLCIGFALIVGGQSLTFNIRATNLPASDDWGIRPGLSDPYVKCFYGIGPHSTDTLFWTTKVIKNSKNPVWNEEIDFPEYQTGAGQYLYFKVYDKDTFNEDDFLGEVLIDADSLGRTGETIREYLDLSNGQAELHIKAIKFQI